VRARGQSDEEARLLVVGAGTEDIAALRGLPGVEVVGHASDEEVAQLLARAKVWPLYYYSHTTILLYYYYTILILLVYGSVNEHPRSMRFVSRCDHLILLFSYYY